jgi:hypothetical protein
MWNFKNQLFIHSDYKLKLFSLSFLNWSKESFNLQLDLQSDQQSPIIIHAFANNICTISGFIYKVYKLFYLNTYEVYSVKNEYGVLAKT